MNKESNKLTIGQLSVFIVDDDNFQLELVAELLRELGVNSIHTFDTAKAALNNFIQHSNKPQLIICDVQMPGMDGFDFLREISNQKYQGGIIVMSGKGNRILNSASLVAQLESEHYLSSIAKPVKKLELETAIFKLLRELEASTPT